MGIATTHTHETEVLNFRNIAIACSGIKVGQEIPRSRFTRTTKIFIFYMVLASLSDRYCLKIWQEDLPSIWPSWSYLWRAQFTIYSFESVNRVGRSLQVNINLLQWLALHLQ